jgi:sucrose-6-phosphate hydrolase SacC (GH32 family)
LQYYSSTYCMKPAPLAFCTMVGATAVAAAAVALSSTAAAASGVLVDPLAPAYHLTNGAAALGQLSGFVALPAADNELAFHVFFARSGQSTWAHLTSTDLLTWTAATDVAAPTGAAGGSVLAIAPAVSPGVNASVVAVALSAPTSTGGSVTASVASEATLSTFVAVVDAAHCGGAGVICPSEQPSSVPLGAASAFQDPAGSGSVVALVVSNNSDLVFFSSSDLISWAASDAPAIAAIPGGVASAELFVLQEAQAAGEAVILWNNAGAARPATLSVGSWDPSKLVFTETARHAGDFGSFAGGKTAVDGQGERVLLGEVATVGTGALSLPRQVYVRADSSIGIRAHPALWGVSECARACAFLRFASHAGSTAVAAVAPQRIDGCLADVVCIRTACCRVGLTHQEGVHVLLYPRGAAACHFYHDGQRKHLSLSKCITLHYQR